MSLVNKIGEIIKEFIIEKYFEYLKDKNILLIENNDLQNVIANVYNQNIKPLKIHIRERLKSDMGSEYPGGSIENILLDLFQDRDVNINRMVMEIDKYQKRNYLEIVRDVGGGGGSLGINLSIDGSFCEINGIRENCRLSNMEIVEKYRYLYSINGIVLCGDSDYVVKVLRDNVNRGDGSEVSREIRLGLYGLFDIGCA